MYVTPDEIANNLSITSKTVREWLKSGDLVGVKFGNSWRVHEKDFERFLEGQRLEMLMQKAKIKHPNDNWIEGQCAQCGVYIPVPDYLKNAVCSQGCKQSYDVTVVNIVGDRGSPEFYDCASNVIPHF